jgi:aminoglycoside phosphotransferase family enzyme/predicted kinase
MPLPEPLQHLLRPAAYPHPVDAVRLIETHISWVLIAGAYAYKIKKPVDLGFLDFSTLERRRFCCQEEIRLNRRLAPDIYLGLVAVTAAGVAAAGAVGEWAVQMRAFPADATLDREAAVTAAQIDAIADRVARFHGEIAPAPAASGYGAPESVIHPVRENVRQIAQFAPPARPGAAPESDRLAALAAWTEAEYARLLGHFAARKAGGFIRECHGDLHLGNIAWVGDAPLIFDCIEFNPALRFIDVISEVAFLCMDLVARGATALAWRFLNRYLEHTGDYAGLAGLRLYLVYRAMVRAKVACIRASQGDAGAAGESARYLDLAGRLARTGRPALLLMHGCSGSGKTWLAQRLLEALGAVRLRADVERKRLHGVAMLADSRQAVGDIYTPEAGRRTFGHLRREAGRLLGDGYLVIVDATFLNRATRADFIALADEARVPCHILSIEADPALLRERISHRRARADDASEADLAVLEGQLASQEPLAGAELALRVAFPAAGEIEPALQRLRERLGGV